MFFIEFTRGVCNWKFYVTVLATVAVALAAGWDNISVMKISGLPETVGEPSIWAAAACMQTEVFMLVLPILCVIPFADSFVEDYQTRFLREYLPKAGRRNYLISKAAVTALTGGLALSVGQIIVLAVCTVIFPLTGIPVGEYTFTYLLYFWGLSFVFMAAMLWAMVGEIAGAAMKNRYMAYATPFIIFYVWSSFQVRYFKSAYVFNPREWIKPEHIETSMTLVYGAIAAAVAFVIYYFVMKRRLLDV